MDCRDIRETISACVDGEASPGEAASVRDHLASCERCRTLERQMRALGAGVRQVRGRVPDRFREEVFARLESEGVLPKRRKAFPTVWRWAAVPLAAAAGLGLFLLTSREPVRGRYRRWKGLPEEQRGYLKDRRKLLKDARPEDRVVVRKFFARMRSLPPEARGAERQKIREWRSLPPGEREEAMRSWSFYRGLSDRERGALGWFLFARPGERPPRE